MDKFFFFCLILAAVIFYFTLRGAGMSELISMLNAMGAWINSLFSAISPFVG